MWSIIRKPQNRPLLAGCGAAAALWCLCYRIYFKKLGSEVLLLSDFFEPLGRYAQRFTPAKRLTSACTQLPPLIVTFSIFCIASLQYFSNKRPLSLLGIMVLLQSLKTITYNTLTMTWSLTQLHKTSTPRRRTWNNPSKVFCTPWQVQASLTCTVHGNT